MAKRRSRPEVTAAVLPAGWVLQLVALHAAAAAMRGGADRARAEMIGTEMQISAAGAIDHAMGAPVDYSACDLDGWVQHFGQAREPAR